MKRHFISEDVISIPMNAFHAVYHRLHGGLCMLNDEAFRVLQKFANGHEIPADTLMQDAIDRESELIQQLLLRGFLVGEQVDEALEPQHIPSKVTVIQLILANACNFGCTYCFEGVQGKALSVEQQVIKIDKLRAQTDADVRVDLQDSMYASKERFENQYDPKNRHMKPEDAVSYVDKAIAVAKASGATEVMVQFFGGEPFLNWKAIHAVLERFGHGAQDGILIHYSTVTNGSLMTEDIAAELARYQVAVCVSFDSPNSTSRPLKNGEDSTPLVTQGLSLLHKHHNRIAINAALTSSTWDEFNEDIVDFAVQYGVAEIGVVVDFDPGFYSRYGADKIAERLWRVVQYGREHGVVLTGYWHQIFQVLTEYKEVDFRGFKNCSAKGAQFSIEPNGNVFSCKAGSSLLGHISMEHGLLAQPEYREHDALRASNPSICQGCEIEGFCAGLCLGSLQKKYGEIDVVETSACEFYRDITRKHVQALRPFEVATFEM